MGRWLTLTLSSPAQCQLEGAWDAGFDATGAEQIGRRAENGKWKMKNVKQVRPWV